MGLSPLDNDICQRLVRELYTEMSLDRLPRRLLPLLAEAIPSERVTYGDFDDRQQRYLIHSYPERHETAAATSGFQAFEARSGKSLATRSAKIFDPGVFKQFKETALFDYFGNKKKRHEMLVYLHQEDQARVTLSFARRQGRFSERDRGVLIFLSPHLAQAYRNAQFTTQVAATLQRIGEGLGAINRAVVLVSSHGWIRWLNPLAQEWLKEFFADFRASPQMLPRKMKEWFLRASRTARHRRPNVSEIQVQASVGSRLFAFCGKTAGEEFLVGLIRERSSIDASIHRLFKLTPRETEILFWISEAKTNPEIAVILNVSLRTVHKHAEHLFAKLGVGNRLEAQRLGLEFRR